MTEASTPTTFPRELESPFALLFPDLKPELATTRRILERVPNGNDDWRPNEKSSTLGQLATHVAQLPGLGILMLTLDEYDGATRPPEPKFADSAERVKMFDEVSGQLRGLLEGMTWDHARAPWKLRFGDRVAAARRSYPRQLRPFSRRAPTFFRHHEKNVS